MTNIGLLDRAFKQPLQTIEVTSATPRESLLETPEALPTTEPETSQVIYTLQQSDFPTLSYGYCQFIPSITAAGRNLSGSTATIYYRVLTNDTSIYTGSMSVNNNNYHTISYHYNFALGIEVGDTIELRLWSSVAGVNWDFKGIMINPTRISFSELDDLLLVDLNVTLSNLSFSLGNPGVYPSNYYFYLIDGKNDTIVSSCSHKLIKYESDYYFGRVYFGDLSSSISSNVSSSYKPYSRVNYFPSKITFRNTGIIL